MINRKFFTIILLIGVLVMNTGILCQSLCLSGHDNMAKHEAKGDICPITHASNNSNHHQSNQTATETFIKCDCSSHFEALLDYETILTPAVDLTPYLQNISEVQPYNVVVINTDLIPLEDPPRILI